MPTATADTTTSWQPMLAPRCRLHRSEQRDCHTCQTRRYSLRRIRQYEISIGTWKGRQPARPVIEHCQTLRAANLGYRQQAARSGIDYRHLMKILAGKYPSVNATTSEALFALTAPDDPAHCATAHRVDGTGTRRRLCGLAREGFGFTYIGQRLGVSRQAIASNSRRWEVFRTTAEKIAALAEELATRSGSDNRARAAAATAGWVPLNAWGDNIDNPAAIPDIADPSTYVDEGKVRRACDGRYLVTALTTAERTAAIRRLASQYKTDHEIAELMRWQTSTGRPAQAAVAAWRSRNGIPSGYQAGLTARFAQDRVDAAIRGELTARDLWPAERRAAVTALAEQGMSDPAISQRLRWNTNPDSGAAAVQIFRAYHSIKAGRKQAAASSRGGRAT